MNPLERGIKYGVLSTLPLVVALGVGCTDPSVENSLPNRPALVLSPSAPGVLTPTPSKDTLNKSLVEQAKKDEVITLQRGGLIKRVFRFPWITGTAYLATLDSGTDRSDEAEAVLDQADCIFDALREKGKLGEEKFGFWKPNEQLDYLQARVVIPSSVTSPVPFLDLEKIVYKEKSFSCHQITASMEFKKILGKINWKKIPENVGAILGSSTRRFIEGFRNGLRSP